MKTSELTGAALDWAVAKCEGHNVFIKRAPVQVMYTPKGKRSWYIYTPSTNWAQGGPIIEREKIGLTYSDSIPCWYATSQQGKRFLRLGETPLIAAMRCHVASNMGNEVNIPEELTK